MHLTPTERDRLLLFTAAELARRRRNAGVLLNVPEATALIADEVCEVARAGGTHSDAVRRGGEVLRTADVLPEVPHVVRTVAVEAVFADGSRLVVVNDPFGPIEAQAGMPGNVVAAPSPGEPESDGVRITVENTAAVPISVTSHFHFFEVNPRLRFARRLGYGMHLDVPAGTHVRFSPGSTTEVTVVPIAGHRVAIGFAGLVDGPLDAPGALEAALSRARACGFLDSESDVPADPDTAVATALRTQIPRQEDHP